MRDHDFLSYVRAKNKTTGWPWYKNANENDALKINQSKSIIFDKNVHTYFETTKERTHWSNQNSHYKNGVSYGTYTSKGNTVFWY